MDPTSQDVDHPESTHPEWQAFICVDVETSGPNPSQYSLLSIGACALADPERTFYAELQPVTTAYTPEAMAVNGLSLAKLAEQGLPPAEAMRRFESWLTEVVPPGVQPIFVAFNAPFDWAFVNDYFHRTLGHNPFGHKALDIKAFYMGLHGVSWEETSYHLVSLRYPGAGPLPHNALQDAQAEVHLFRQMLVEVTRLKSSSTKKVTAQSIPGREG